MSNNKNDKVQNTTGQKPTIAERFISKVRDEFANAVGQSAKFTEYEKRLASNLYLKVDSSLKEFEAKRQDRNDTKKTPYTWDNINLQQLAIDAVHRIRLGLDALIPNHLHAIPYWNRRTGQYDLDLQIGYVGKDYYRRQVAADKIIDIRYELKYETDDFRPLKKNASRDVESYEFEINQPFDRGTVEGGFGYIVYEDQSKNKLVIVPKSDFDKIEEKAKSDAFWKEWREKMQYKTLVNAVTKEIRVDPEKVNTSYHYVEQQDNMLMQAEEQKQIEAPKELIDINTDMEVEEGHPVVQKAGVDEDVANDGGGSSDEAEKLIAQINELGKSVYDPSTWYKESKNYVRNVDPEAENLLGLNIGGLMHVKKLLESELRNMEEV